MPRNRSTFTKRQKEQRRLQRQVDKAERKNQRKQEKLAEGNSTEMAELHQDDTAQTGSINPGIDESPTVEKPTDGNSMEF
jgi:hypothetical protein